MGASTMEASALASWSYSQPTSAPAGEHRRPAAQPPSLLRRPPLPTTTQCPIASPAQTDPGVSQVLLGGYRLRALGSALVEPAPLGQDWAERQALGW